MIVEKNYYQFKHTGILIVNNGCRFNIKNLGEGGLRCERKKKEKKSKLTLPEKLILASAKYFQFRPYAKD